MKLRKCYACKIEQDILNFTKNNVGNLNMLCNSCKFATTRLCKVCEKIQPVESFQRISDNRLRYTCNSCRNKKLYRSKKKTNLTKIKLIGNPYPTKKRNFM